MRRIAPLTPVLCLLLLAPTISAQERAIEEAGLPQNTADRLLGIANDPATLRLPGDSRVAADSVLAGDVLVTGPLYLAGHVEGDLIVVDGDLEMASGARVQGDLTVIQGDVRGSEEATIGGTLIAYRRSSRYVQRGERTREVTERTPRLEHHVHAGGSVRFGVRAGDYNRVEGLPVRVGPILDTGGRNPFRAESQLIWRTEGKVPFAADRLGFDVKAEQFLGGRRELRLGGGVHSTIGPVERWGLTDGENSWSTFLLTSDERDYFERRGWSAFLRATPRRLPLDVTVEYRDEEQGSVAAGDPWTLFRSDRPWRAQPVVAEGSLRSAVVSLEIDTRDDHRDPVDGWLVRTTWHRGLGGSLALPPTEAWSTGEEDEGGVAPSTTPDLDARFSAGLLDVRRYQPVGHRGALALRGVVGGSPGGDLLPPQYQHALGGVGSLPGHRRFSADCGARSSQVGLERDGAEAAMFPFYGCDRFALAQAEYRGPVDLDVGFGSFDNDRRGHRHSSGGPSWAVFFNAGRAWTTGDWGELVRPESTTLYDAGLGLLLGHGGVYWAVPLGEGVSGSTFTIRLSRRF